MLWLIDLDDTLFHASKSMFDAIHHAMNDELVRTLDVSEDEAHRLRTHYWALYGATYEGVWRHHRLDPLRFLEATHGFDILSHVPTNTPTTHGLWSKLPGRKVIYTNGPRFYAETILEHLGIRQAFDGVVTSSESFVNGAWHAKPSGLMFAKILRDYRTSPHNACMIDDSLKNLRMAAKCGLKTVWMTGFKATQPSVTPDYVDYRTKNLWTLLKFKP